MAHLRCVAYATILSATSLLTATLMSAMIPTPLIPDALPELRNGLPAALSAAVADERLLPAEPSATNAVNATAATNEPGDLSVLSFSLCGSDNRYVRGMVANAQLARTIYPGWQVRVYYDATVPALALSELAAQGPHVQLIDVTDLPEWRSGWLGHVNPMAWRFLVASDPSVAVYAVRDADSRLGLREKAAVDEWLGSGKAFHVMHDHIAHDPGWIPVMGGMWGGLRRAAPHMAELLREHYYNRAENETHYGYGEDQRFLRDVVWPLMRDDSLHHDSFHCDGSGGIAFPTANDGDAEGYDFVGESYQREDAWLVRRAKGVFGSLSKMGNPIQRKEYFGCLRRRREALEDSAQNGQQKQQSAGCTTNDTASALARHDALRPLRRSHRFPLHGTEEFDRACSWTKAEPTRNCTVYVGPKHEGGEGISEWTAAVATGYIYAVQAGCRYLLDYGPDVAIDRVLIPVGADPLGRNWIVPNDFECGKWCIHTHPGGIMHHDLVPFSTTLGLPSLLAPAPSYRRLAYSSGFNDTDLKRALPGFTFQSGMACAWGGLFRLAPTAEEYVPGVLTTILPALRDPNAFVLSLYVRTGWADIRANHEKDPRKDSPGFTVERWNSSLHATVECALHLEAELAPPKLGGEDADFSHVIWVVVTDAVDMGRSIASSYNGSTSGNIPREVMTTLTRGVQTRTRRRPSTKDFAEAVIDWYLLGESDAVVVTGSYSFGETGALRAMRPIYKTGDMKVRTRDGMNHHAGMIDLRPFAGGCERIWNPVEEER